MRARGPTPRTSLARRFGRIIDRDALHPGHCHERSPRCCRGRQVHPTALGELEEGAFGWVRTEEFEELLLTRLPKGESVGGQRLSQSREEHRLFAEREHRD